MKISGIITGSFSYQHYDDIKLVLCEILDKIKEAIDIDICSYNRNVIQILVRDAENTMKAFLLLKSGLTAKSICINLDIIIIEDADKFISPKPPSLTHNFQPARRSFATHFSSPWKDIDNELVVDISFIDGIIDNWTGRQAYLMFIILLDETYSQKEIAHKSEVSVQSVSKTLIAAKRTQIKLFLQRFKDIVSDKIERTSHSQSSIDKIEKLKDNDDFLRDDTYDKYHKKITGNHITYKYKVQPEEKDSTRIVSKDGSRAYEFLIEFDKQDFGYGIFLGCRCLILKGDFQKQKSIIEKEWETIKPSVIKILGDTFQGKDFSNRFYAAQTNGQIAIWPFWLTLGKDEDITIASLVTKVIAKTYNAYIRQGELLLKSKFSRDDRKNERINETWFTDESYKSIKERLNSLHQWNSFKAFIDKAMEANVISMVAQYERCYKFNNLNVVEIAYFIKSLTGTEKDNDYGPLLSHPILNFKTDSNKRDIWIYFMPLFIDKENKTLRNIKSVLSHSHKKNEADIKRKVTEEYTKCCLW